MRDKYLVQLHTQIGAMISEQTVNCPMEKVATGNYRFLLDYCNNIVYLNLQNLE